MIVAVVLFVVVAPWTKTTGTLLTLTETGALLALLPALSRATAVNVCVPLAVVRLFHEIEYGEVVTGLPRLLPSRTNCTEATPTLSLAEAVTVTVLATVEFATGAVMDTVGGVTSIIGVLNVKSAEEARFPAASLECTR